LGSEEDTDSDEEEDYADDLPELIKNREVRHRTSVSAEAFGQWNQRKVFIPKVYQKTDEQAN